MSPDYEATRQQLADRRLSVLIDTGDPRVLGDGTTFDKPPFSSPPEPTLRKKK